jgi:hypothetical protein
MIECILLAICLILGVFSVVRYISANRIDSKKTISTDKLTDSYAAELFLESLDVNLKYSDAKKKEKRAIEIFQENKAVRDLNRTNIVKYKNIIYLKKSA